MKRIKKGLRVIKDSGLIHGSKIILDKMKNQGTLNNPNFTSSQKDLFKFYEYIYFNANRASFFPEGFKNIKVLWFIPDFGIGSGGHLNIFRMIFNLSKLGLKSDIAICGNSQWINTTIAREMIDRHFFKLESQIMILRDKEDIGKLNNYHVAMATSWQTAYYVNTFAKCNKKAYFVQDFEPYFYPHGSSYIFAENTYRFGFYGITAGSWLSKKLVKEYDMQCDCFSFSYDRELYYKHKRREDKRRVFFYARPPTDRRAFELGLLVLKKLCEKNSDIEVVLAGWDTSEYYIPFKHFNPGVVALNELSHIYSQCDVALVLSFTNLSLLPLELLASGCPVVTNSGENNSWIDPEKRLFIYSENNVDSLTKTLDRVLNNKIKIDEQYVNNFLQQTSWEKEAKNVHQFLHHILMDKE